MKPLAFIVGMLYIPLVTCCTTTQSWPQWADNLAERLECGMSLQAIRALTEREVVPWSNIGALKAHHISSGQVDFWLYFDDQGLQSIALSKIDGWRVMSTRFSPLRDLCTGELFFLLRLSLPENLQEADVFLDGRKVHKDDWLGPFIKVLAGQHQLRVEMEGYEPIVKHLTLDAEDRGEQVLFLSTPRLSAPILPNGHGL